MAIIKQPTWTENKNRKSYPQLRASIAVDVAVIGGGLAGIFQAYLLSKAGKKVAVLEAAEIGSGVTSATTAFLTADIDTNAEDLIAMYGLRKARMVWESHAEAISTIEQITKKEAVGCEFMRCSAYRYATSESEAKGLEKESAAIQKLGFPARMFKPQYLPFQNFGGIEIRNQAKFHPLKFLYALAGATASGGAQIYENSCVRKVSGNGPYTLTTQNGSIKATDIVIATYYPLGNPKTTFFKKGMYRSFILEAEIPKNSFEPAIYWSLENPYHYFRVDANGKRDRIILGGADRRKEIPLDDKKSFRDIEEHLKMVMGKYTYVITRKWSGPILEPTDGLALIGAVGPHRYVATAFSGNGMTYSAISARLNTDLILKKKNGWKALYDPTRIPSFYQLYKKGLDYTGELIGGALKDLFK